MNIFDALVCSIITKTEKKTFELEKIARENSFAIAFCRKYLQRNPTSYARSDSKFQVPEATINKTIKNIRAILSRAKKIIKKWAIDWLIKNDDQINTWNRGSSARIQMRNLKSYKIQIRWLDVVCAQVSTAADTCTLASFMQCIIIYEWEMRVASLSTARVRENLYHYLYQSSGIAVNWKIVILIRRCSRYLHSARRTRHILYELYDTLQLRRSHSVYSFHLCQNDDCESFACFLPICRSSGSIFGRHEERRKNHHREKHNDEIECARWKRTRNEA